MIILENNCKCCKTGTMHLTSKVNSEKRTEVMIPVIESSILSRLVVNNFLLQESFWIFSSDNGFFQPGLAHVKSNFLRANCTIISAVPSTPRTELLIRRSRKQVVLNSQCV